MRKRLQQYEITDDIRQHPAVVAWRTCSGGEPTAVIALKERIRPTHKSAVYLLRGAGPDGTDIVAKHTWNHGGAIATGPAVSYTMLGRASGRVAPRLLATVPVSGALWMFFEYVGGVPFDPQDLEHRRGAARLAARIHRLEPTHEELAELPLRDARYYQQQFRHVGDALRSFEIERGALCPPIVAQFLARLDTVIDSWELVEKCFHDYPAAVVHGDFTAKNLFVQSHQKQIEVLAVDWETVGFGYRFADLECVDLDEYCSMSGLGAEGRASELLAALRVGSVLRLIDRAAWTVMKLRGSRVDRPIRHLESLDRAFGVALGAAT